MVVGSSPLDRLVLQLVWKQDSLNKLILVELKTCRRLKHLNKVTICYHASGLSLLVPNCFPSQHFTDTVYLILVGKKFRNFLGLFCLWSQWVTDIVHDQGFGLERKSSRLRSDKLRSLESVQSNVTGKLHRIGLHKASSNSSPFFLLSSQPGSSGRRFLRARCWPPPTAWWAPRRGSDDRGPMCWDCSSKRDSFRRPPPDPQLSSSNKCRPRPRQASSCNNNSSNSSSRLSPRHRSFLGDKF
jgi:hypothetical protein